MQQETIGTQARPIMRPVLVRQPMSTGHTAYHHLGGVVDEAWTAGRMAAVGFATFHGYQRHKSIPWTLVWALCAYISPIVTTGVAVAQRTILKKR